jgi:two-component system phosphate regulon sensor histidine kinase PhoR
LEPCAASDTEWRNSVRKKIVRSIFLACLLVLLACLALIMGLLYRYYSDVQMKQLEIESELAANGVNVIGSAYFEGLSMEDYRITWIDQDGTVLYDSSADSSAMENHLGREEVQQALQTGYGESSRYSDTLSKRLLYSARRLDDGTVLRVSTTQASIWTLLLAFLQPICLILILALMLSYLLAYRLSKRIVAPINSMDLDNPIQYIGKDEYKEVEPLLRRISRQQQQLRENQEELEKTSLIRQEFTANASHELKTPLHAISGYAELIENGMVKKQDIRPFAGKIRAESQRMTKLVEDIIDLSKLDRDDVKKEEWEDVDLYRVAENAVDSLKNEAEEANVSVNLSGSSAIVYGLPTEVYSIVYNFCDNAIKYNRPGGTVTVRVSEEPDRISLVVADTGIGIPEEDRARIFERFYRVDKSRSKEVGGTGLGLSIVKHAAMNLHATIDLRSELGRGTTFEVNFPKPKEKTSDPEEEPDAENETAWEKWKRRKPEKTKPDDEKK